MELTDFFAKYQEIFAQDQRVILFTAKSYNLLFFDRLLEFIQTKISSPFKKINFDQFDLADIQRAIHTTFLGQTYIYWFGDLSSLTSKKKKAEILELLQVYQGPHVLCGFVSDDDKGEIKIKSVQISIQETYSYDQIKKFPLFYEDQRPEIVAQFLGKLFRIKQEYSLDQLCLLQRYAGLLGKNVDLFFDQWIDQLVISDVSLFYVSQLFFEKKAKEFFKVWAEIRSYYSDQFWTAFFSEQLFKAYFYVHAHGKIPADQKPMTYGLPFSFLKQDFKFYSTAQLQEFHQRIYDVDLALKSGGSTQRLELFLTQFFVESSAI